jgi:hypothetical protein
VHDDVGRKQSGECITRGHVGDVQGKNDRHANVRFSEMPRSVQPGRPSPGVEDQASSADQQGREVNAKQCKRARGIAMQEARKRNLWAKGEDQVYAKWWCRLLARFFPKLRAKWDAWIGKWYKYNVKLWAKSIRASVHDQELRSFLLVQARNKRKEARKQREVALQMKYLEEMYQKNVSMKHWNNGIVVTQAERKASKA